jgi:APA family basic amino acid/polyamine antiporter
VSSTVSGQPSAATGLRRELGLASASLLVVGGIIGSGIFFLPGDMARALESPALILAVWVVGGVVAIAGALTFAELGAMYPEAGGPYVYIREAFGPLWAFLHGWMILLMIASGAIAAVALSFGNYLGRFVDISVVGGPIGVATITIVAVTALNVLGIRTGTFAANVFTVAKLAALSAIIVLGLAVTPQSTPASGPPAELPSLVAGLSTAFVAVLFAIGGWQQTNMVAGEIRDPAKNLPRALVIGVAIVITVYLGANIAYLKVLGRDGLAASTTVASDTMQHLFGDGAARAITVGVMLSIFGFVNVALLTNARVLFALGRDGMLFPAAGAVHPRFGSPHVALWMLGAWSLALLYGTRGSLGDLLSGVVFADWVFFGMSAAAVIRLRQVKPDLPRPYRVAAYPWLPGAFVLCALIGIAAALISAPKMSLVGTAMLIAGVAVYFMRRKAVST